MKMTALIQKTAEQKAAAKTQKIQDGYKTILNILQNDLQGAEMLPGAILKLSVANIIGDEFNNGIKDTGSDVLTIGGFRIWRSTTSRGVIQVEGINPSHIDEQWDELINELKDRAEML